MNQVNYSNAFLAWCHRSKMTSSVHEIFFATREFERATWLCFTIKKLCLSPFKVRKSLMGWTCLINWPAGGSMPFRKRNLRWSDVWQGNAKDRDGKPWLHLNVGDIFWPSPQSAAMSARSRGEFRWGLGSNSILWPIFTFVTGSKFFILTLFAEPLQIPPVKKSNKRFLNFY